jgi:hypothetical protein
MTAATVGSLVVQAARQQDRTLTLISWVRRIIDGADEFAVELLMLGRCGTRP